MERVLGAEVGDFLRACTRRTASSSISAPRRRLDGQTQRDLLNGETLDADLVVIGIGVRPAVWAGATGRPGGGPRRDGRRISAKPARPASSPPATSPAGRIRLSGEAIRVEHWVVAERQGQIAARNMLGRRERYDAVPFFWTEQYDFVLAYTGHAAQWDQAELDGSLEARDCTIRYRRGGKLLAVAVVQRDLEGFGPKPNSSG